MSQVKKLQSGGSMIIDGIKYDATPEFINSLTKHIRSTAGTDAQTLAGLTNALLNGEQLTYDSASNTITGMSGKWGGITDRQNELRRANTSSWRKSLDAWTNNDAHRFRKALTALGTFSYTPETEEETPANLTDISSDRAWFEYIKDPDTGEDKWSEQSSLNPSLFKRIDDMTAYLRDPEAGKKLYKLGAGYTPEYMQQLQTWYNNNKDKWDATVKAIKEEAQAGNLDPDHIAFLNNLFIVKPSDVAAAQAADAAATAERKKFTDAGYGNDIADLLADRAHIASDGSIELNDGEDWGWNLGDLTGRNIWFNDDFFRSRYGADRTFNPFRNYTLYNNRLYALDNPTLANILNVEGGFNAMKRAGNWTGADNEILTRFTDSNRENPSYLNNDSYSTFLSKNPNYRFSDLTGLYTINGMTKGDQLIQYVDLNENSLVGPYRNYTYKYAILDQNGNLKMNNIDPASITEIAGGRARESGLNTYRRTVGSNNGSYNDRYYEDILDSKGDATGFRVYYDINNPDNDVILHMPEIKAAGVREQDLKLPIEIARVLIPAMRSENGQVWENIVGNAQNKKDFIQLLSSLVRSHATQGQNSWLPFDLRTNDEVLLRRLGFTDESLNELVNAFKNARKGTRAQRRSDILVNPPQFEKNGGVIKEQTGGKAGGSKNSTGITERRINTKNTNPKNSAGIAEIGGNNWTDADTADIAALFADLGSLTTAFIPGANIASAVTGAAGSTARLAADVKRGTKGALPNYLVNLGMDATMLIPILGGMGKIASVPSRVAKIMPTLLKAASVYGLGAGFINTAKKIASGEKFTVRDVDMLVNTLTAAIGLGKSGGFGKSKKGTAIKDIDINAKTETVNGATVAKEGTKTFKIAGKDLNNVTDVEAFKKLIVNKAKAAGDTTVTLENVGERYDLSKWINGAKWRPGFNPKTWFKKREKLDTFETQSTGTKQSETALGRFHRGEGQYQREYNAQLRGETPTRTAVYELTRTDTNVYPTEPRVFRTKGQVKSKEIPLSQYEGRQFTSEIIPGGFTTLGQGPGMVQNPGTATYTGYITRANPVPLKGIALSQWIYPFTDANNQRNRDVQPSGAVMRPLFRKEGGKIVKGQIGFKTTMLDPTKINYGTFAENYKSPELVQTPKFEVPTFKKIDVPQTTDHQGTFNKLLRTPDLTVPMNWARAIYSMGESDKQLKNFLDRPEYQMQSPLLNAPRFISTGKGDAYRAMADKMRISKPATSDAIQNDLMQRQRQQDALNAEAQAIESDSQEYGQYLSGLSDFLNNNTLRNTEIANQNRQLRWQHEIENVTQRNANIAQKSKFFDEASYATQDWYKQNLEKLGKLRASEAYNEKLKALNTEYEAKMKAYRKLDPTSQLAKDTLSGINTWLALQKSGLENVGLEYSLSPLFRRTWERDKGIYKKGGKVTSGKDSKVTYSRDPYPELLLQNAKGSDKYVEKLSDAVIKLLLQTKPIHVN